MMLMPTVQVFMTMMVQLVLLFAGISLILGIVNEFISKNFISRMLTNESLRGNFIGATLGSLTPFCSITTIPILVSFMNAGASFGSSMSFFLVSPLVNPVIISLFWILFGWEITIMYGLLCFMAAVILGAVWERLKLFEKIKHHKISNLSSCNSKDLEKPEERFHIRLQRIFKSSWNQFKSLMPFLILGAGLGAIIYGLVPEGWIVNIAGPENPWAIPVAALAGTSLYVGVETMFPITKILLDMGMGIGAVMALTITAAGISVPEVIFLSSIFKMKLLLVYVSTILVISVGMGYISVIL
ncbi:permease [Alkalibacillus salilacus]|uniref:Uncharacterized membrane protein YraQ (UPF0718 family) n=1 Tax=Alkalibacillus salilacus TaxID=284582 RepID=A0ABT9VBM3_9BACI|nr:permease [Alkalibacillus salilacus]MDQ0158341.1 uncharacterized membrane protein YraQ (UPF0718 family) [Alkalibacillus salilacus]